MKRYEVLQEGWIDGDYRRKGETVPMDDAAAKWLVLGGQIAEATASSVAAAAPAAASKASPLDHDGDGKAGGSLPAIDVGDLNAAGLAVAADLGQIDFNTLRIAAKRFLGEVPAKKADIIAALNAVEAKP